jgi:hypothetical protein
VEDDSRSRRRRQNSQIDRGAAVESYPFAGHSRTNCLLVCQGEDAVSLCYVEAYRDGRTFVCGKTATLRGWVADDEG